MKLKVCLAIALAANFDMSFAANKKAKVQFSSDVFDDAFVNDVAAQSAFELTKMLADEGRVTSQLTVAGMYLNWHTVKQDYQKALYYYQLAADQGNGEALYNLANMYRLGKGVVANDKVAFDLYERSANNGYAYAQIHLGFMYYYGMVVEQNPDMAYELHDSAVKQGAITLDEINKIHICISEYFMLDMLTTMFGNAKE